jgi:hypothetical protein
MAEHSEAAAGLLIGVPRERATGERRVAASPDSVKRLITKLGFRVQIEAGAGVEAGFTDAAYAAAGAGIVDLAAVWGQSDLVLKVNPPLLDTDAGVDELSGARRGLTLVCPVQPAQNKALVERMATLGLTVLALDCVPRITRAQNSDVLSSMANIAGYRAVIEAAMPVVRAAGGGVFFLFTTLRAMRQAQELLFEALRREHLDFPLLAQGEGSRSALLERFRQLGNAILVGSSSFWEGVDVRGQALSVVVIDKLPFAPPDDPVLKARLDAMQRAGRNAFMEYQLPQAAIILKQGAGRLIRRETDQGVLVVCDTRLVAMGYGRRLLRALPPMQRLSSESELLQRLDLLTKTCTTRP